jgi:hypothetical protein
VRIEFPPLIPKNEEEDEDDLGGRAEWRTSLSFLNKEFKEWWIHERNIKWKGPVRWVNANYNEPDIDSIITCALSSVCDLNEARQDYEDYELLLDEEDDGLPYMAISDTATYSENSDTENREKELDWPIPRLESTHSRSDNTTDSSWRPIELANLQESIEVESVYTDMSRDRVTLTDSELKDSELRPAHLLMVPSS